MKQILEEWSGKFMTETDVSVNLDNLKVKDGDEFHVRLIPKNREVDDGENLLSAR